jgi:hypothetical protein
LYKVSSNDLRQKAPDALKPFLASFPVSTQPDNGNGLSYYTAGYSEPSSIDTTSIRIDHSFSDKFKIFGRYSDSPSNVKQRTSQSTSAGFLADLFQLSWTQGFVSQGSLRSRRKQSSRQR